jgi:phosphosulfolactate synthase (CoM biosynthesis protein A)
MARKFRYKFSLTFVEADYFFKMFLKDKCKILEYLKNSKTKEESEWHERDLQYTNDLVKKMTHTVDMDNYLIVFDYTVDGVDSGNIFHIMRREKLDKYEDIMDELVEGKRLEFIEWHKHRQRYSDYFVKKIGANVEITGED